MSLSPSSIVLGVILLIATVFGASLASTASDANDPKIPDFSINESRVAYQQALSEMGVRWVFLVLTSETNGDFDTAVEGISKLPVREQINALDELARLMCSSDPSHRLWATDAMSRILSGDDPAKMEIGINVKAYHKERNSAPAGNLMAYIEFEKIKLSYSNLVGKSEFDTKIEPKIIEWWKARRGAFFMQLIQKGKAH